MEIINILKKGELVSQTMLKAKNGDKESVMVLYHSLVEHEKLISEVKQALKEE